MHIAKFFLSDQKSLFNDLTKTSKLFSKLSSLKANMLKCDVVGIDSLKVVKMAISGIKCIDLTTKTIKILIHFSYNQKLEIQKKKQKYITNMQYYVLNFWRMGNITLHCIDLRNISAILNCISKINNLILKTVNRRNTKITKKTSFETT